jgi:hypothetical protein
MQFFGKHATTIQTVFSAWSVRRSYLGDSRRYKELRVDLWSANQRTTVAEKSRLLIFATRKRVVETLQMNRHFGELL